MEAGEVRVDAAPRPFQALTFREARPDEWARSRELRLEMLGDTPHSFGDHLSDALLWDDDRWMTRHHSHLLPDSAVLVAVTDDGRWVGHMAVREFHNYCPPRIWLMGVYVTPGHRGDGTAEALLEMAESWTAHRGFTELYLDVHEHAVPAQRFYARQGFAMTGHTAPYPLDVATSELEMVKALNVPVGGGGASAPGGDPEARC